MDIAALDEVHTTWQVPWLGLVEVDVADNWRGEAGVHGLPSEVAGDELLVRREEPKARRQELHSLRWQAS